MEYEYCVYKSIRENRIYYDGFTKYYFFLIRTNPEGTVKEFDTHRTRN